MGKLFLSDAQRELLDDKLDLWRRAAGEGPMDSRDYNRRAVDALTILLETYDANDAGRRPLQEQGE